MNRRIITAFAAALLCCAAAFPAAAAQVESDTVYCFTEADFSSEEALAGICITGLPDPQSGTVMLGARVLRSGDVLTAEQLDLMTFHPLTGETDREASVSYLPIYADRVEAVTTLSLEVMGRADEAPIAENSAMETYRNLPNEAMLKVTDPEGKPMTYTVTRTPKRGDVIIREDGSFLYTPRKNKVGTDSFTYTATDPAGNVSREATVTITVLKPSDAQQYTDTTGKSCRFAAEWMKNTGIFVGETFNGNGCFSPDKQVSRGDFLTMLVGALEIPLEEDVQSTGFTDDCASWLKPYLAAAMRSGLTAGWPEGNVFGADQPITGAEAAVMLQNALDLTAAEAAAQDEAVPAWAADALLTLASHGIVLEADGVLTRGDAAEVIYQVSQLKSTAPGLLALRAAQ